MAENFISIEEAENNLLSCATFLSEDIKSAEGYAEAMKAIIPHYLERGDVDTAAGLADTVDDPFVRDRLLMSVAEKCAAIGRRRIRFSTRRSHRRFRNAGSRPRSYCRPESGENRF